MAKAYDDADELRRLYWQEEMSQYGIADHFGVSPSKIKYRFRKHGIETRGENPISEDELREAYEGRTIEEAAEYLDSNRTTVDTLLRRYGIEKKSNSEVQQMRADKERNHYQSFQTTTQGYEIWHGSYRGEKEQCLVHRLLAVAEYGFDLVASAEVHHINGIKWDNRPGNIDIMNHDAHMVRHWPVEKLQRQLSNLSDDVVRDALAQAGYEGAARRVVEDT